jgi:hypothetical protein
MVTAPEPKIIYDQESGGITLRKTFIGTGYSGFGPGLDNPDMEAEHNIGPIPRGDWQIVRWDDHHGEKGPQVAVLEPVGHDAHGRSAFLIHGDNPDLNHGASHGCIIASRAIRDALRASGETALRVIA